MRIVSFGCSLSRQGSDNIEFPNYYNKNSDDFKSGVVRTLANLNRSEYLNYAISSTGLQKLNQRFSEYMLSEYREDDIILWQFTNYSRKFYDFLLPETIDKETCGISFENYYNAIYYIHNTNNIDFYEGYHSLSYLSHHPSLGKMEYFSPGFPGTRFPVIEGMSYNTMQHIVDSLANLKTIKQMGNPVLCWFGWHGCLTIQSYNKLWDHNTKVEKHLNDMGVDFVKERYLEWTIKKNLPQLDTTHPCPFKAAPLYAEKVLYPKLRSVLSKTTK